MFCGFWCLFAMIVCHWESLCRPGRDPDTAMAHGPVGTWCGPADSAAEARQLPTVCYGGPDMTKPRTDFADDDLAIARRALWLLEGHAPGREHPPPDMDLNRFTNFNGSDGFALPLAHFGLIRHMDAIRASPPPTAPADSDDSPSLRDAEAGQRRDQHEACRLEKRACEQLREALLRSDNAVEAWQTAAARRADSWARTPAQFLTGEHQRILEALFAAQGGTRAALDLMDASMRQLPPANVTDSFPSTFGLPLAERNDALGEQALNLSEAGISVEAIGYVMGWSYGTPEQSKDRTRKRLEEARARRAPSAL